MKAILRTETAKDANGDIIRDIDGRDMINIKIIKFSDNETMIDYLNLFPWYYNQIFEMVETEIKSIRKI